MTGQESSTLSQGAETGSRSFRINTITILGTIAVTLIASLFPDLYPALAIFVVGAVSILLLFNTSFPLHVKTLDLDTRLLVDAETGRPLPSPTPSYRLQDLALQFFERECKPEVSEKIRKYIDGSSVTEPPDCLVRALEKALLEIIKDPRTDVLPKEIGVHRNCLGEYYRGKRHASEPVKSPGGAHLPPGFSLEIKRESNGLFTIMLKRPWRICCSNACKLKITVALGSSSKQVAVGEELVPTVDDMPITHYNKEQYQRLLEHAKGLPEDPLFGKKWVTGVVARMHFHTVVEVSYNRLWATFRAGEATSCLRYLECLVEILRDTVDWSHVAKRERERALRRGISTILYQAGARKDLQ